MFYSEAIAVLEIPLSSFSRTLIFCSIDKVSCFLLGFALPPSWISDHVARPRLKVDVATSCNQILQEHAVRLTGQFGFLVFISLKSYCTGFNK